MKPEKKMKNGSVKFGDFDAWESNTSLEVCGNVYIVQTLRKIEIVFEFRKSYLKFLIMDRSTHNFTTGNKKVQKNGDSRYA